MQNSNPSSLVPETMPLTTERNAAPKQTVAVAMSVVKEECVKAEQPQERDYSEEEEEEAGTE